MASLRIVVHEENGKFLGHRILPVDAIQSGQWKWGGGQRALSILHTFQTSPSQLGIFSDPDCWAGLWVRRTAALSLILRAFIPCRLPPHLPAQWEQHATHTASSLCVHRGQGLHPCCLRRYSAFHLVFSQKAPLHLNLFWWSDSQGQGSNLI